MFFPDLRYVVADSPNWWQAYALATLTRAVGLENQSLLNAWSAWAGGSAAILISPGASHLSAIGVVRDANTAIVACYGTRNLDQAILEVAMLPVRPSPLIHGRVHGFFLSCFLEQHPGIMDALSGMSNQSHAVFTGHSLGGAIAHIMANAAVHNNVANVRGLLTFGQPRTGDFDFAEAGTYPYLRIANSGDIIPGIFPSWFSFPVPIGFNWFPPSRLRYWHGGKIKVMLSDGSATGSFWSMEVEVPGSVIRNFPDWYLEGTVLNPHYLKEYIRRLRIQADAQTGRPSITALHNLNGHMDALDLLEESEPVRDTDAFGTGGTWDDPNTVITGGPTTVHAPQGDVGRIVETRGVSHSLFLYGRPEIVKNTFRGRDRRLLRTLQKVCDDIIARDARAALPKKTTALSTRALMFPTGGSPDLGQAIGAVAARAFLLLGQQND